MSYDIQAAFGKRTKLNCLNTIEICVPSGNVRMMSEVYFIFGIYLEYFFGQNKYIFAEQREALKEVLKSFT